MVIQHNLVSINANNKLQKNISGIKKSSEKLSSGYRINRAGDDAAGLAVSEKMRAQIRGLGAAIKNCQDGINLIKTFEGALSETTSIIQRMKELAEQSANGTYDNAIDRSAIELEYIQLCDETDHIAETDFNGIVMLSGKPEGAAAAAELENSVNSAAVLPEIVSAVSAVSVNGAVPEIKAVAAVSAANAAPKAGGVTCGDFTVYGDAGNFSFDSVSGELTILGGDITVEGTGAATTNTIIVAKDKSANVTLNNVNINVSSKANICAFQIEEDSAGDVNIILKGANRLISGYQHAGLEKNTSVLDDYTIYGTLTISGDGSLHAESGNGGSGSGAGIGGGGENSCNIVIESGNITAIGTQGSGIGGGSSGTGANIVINGGTVNASSNYDSGIGGGINGNAVDITINGGNITATGGQDGGSGIGGGLSGSANKITINGGTVIAKTNSDGAGIGGGCEANADNIVINGGTVTATGGGIGNAAENSAGIGSGAKCTKGSTITINGGTVTAIGGGISASKGSAGIGSSHAGGKSTVNISGKDTVVMAKGGKDADDIGGIGGTSAVNIDNILTKEPYSGSGITDGTIVHYNGNKPNDPSDPNDPEVPHLPGERPQVSTRTSEGSAKLTYTGDLILQTGARTKDSVQFTFSYESRGIGELKPDLNCTAEGLGLAALSLKTQYHANYAIDQLDHALNKVSLIRATFGSAQNRLEHKVTNLANVNQNLTEAESAIRDTDMAKEMMNYTKSNILQQAAQTMLAQANQIPQNTLQLLG